MTTTLITDPSTAPTSATDQTTRIGGGSPTVLMGFAEAMAAIEAAWSLQQAGYRVVAFRRRGRRAALHHVRGVQLYDVPAPELDVQATLNAVQSLIDRVGPATVLPLDDHSLWLCRELAGAEEPIAGATDLAVDCALDKSLQVATAERAGIPVPRTRVLADPRDAAPIDAPVIVKAAQAVCEAGGRLTRPSAVVCATEAELELAAARSWHGPVIVQPLIRGVGEGMFGHAGANGITGWSAHRRVRMFNPHGSSSSACESVDVDEELVEPTSRFLESIGWRGMFMLEFLRDAEGTPWFMELNGRAWGSMALARRRGFEYPAWTVNAALDPLYEPTVPDRPPEALCRNLGLELVYLMFVMRGPQSDTPVEWPPLSRAIRDVFGRHPGGRWYNWNAEQPHVLVRDAAITVSDAVLKVFRRRRP
jgi:biotin carboxylase